MDDLDSTQVLTTATRAAHPAATLGPAHTKHFDHQTLINIIFGIFAVVLAIAALIVAWLQLRKFNHESDAENANNSSENFELVETQ